MSTDHDFEPDPDVPEGCARCGLPRANARHHQHNRQPGPDLGRLDRDATATGVCTDCPRTFRTFEASTRHASREQHTVQVTERRVFDVVPRNRKDHQQ